MKKLKQMELDVTYWKERANYFELKSRKLADQNKILHEQITRLTKKSKSTERSHGDTSSHCAIVIPSAYADIKSSPSAQHIEIRGENKIIYKPDLRSIITKNIKNHENSKSKNLKRNTDPKFF